MKEKKENDEYEFHLKEWYKLRRKTKIIFRLEQGNKYLEKNITPRMVCALFDLPYMMEEGTWKVIKLNGIEKDLGAFFRINEYIDEAMHGNQIGEWDSIKNKLIWRMKKKNEYLFGKPKWNMIKRKRRNKNERRKVPSTRLQKVWREEFEEREKRLGLQKGG